MAVAAIVQEFDAKFAEGYNPRRREEDLHDFFVMQIGEPPVVLHSREGNKSCPRSVSNAYQLYPDQTTNNHISLGSFF